jgi:hypothetical protein
MQAILSGVITIFFYAIIIAAVWKVFMMATDLGEIKTILADIRKNSTGLAAPAPKPAGAYVPAAAPVVPAVLSQPISLESAEALLREVAAEEQALAQQAKPIPTALPL